MCVCVCVCVHACVRACVLDGLKASIELGIACHYHKSEGQVTLSYYRTFSSRKDHHRKTTLKNAIIVFSSFCSYKGLYILTETASLTASQSESMPRTNSFCNNRGQIHYPYHTVTRYQDLYNVNVSNVKSELMHRSASMLSFFLTFKALLWAIICVWLYHWIFFLPFNLINFWHKSPWNLIFDCRKQFPSRNHFHLNWMINFLPS